MPSPAPPDGTTVVTSRGGRRRRPRVLLPPPLDLPLAAAVVVVIAASSSSAAAALSVPKSRVVPPLPPRVAVSVGPVRGNADLIDLADLRYDEWIAAGDGGGSGGGGDDGNGGGGGGRIPSREAFRMATADVMKERSELGAVTYLARFVADGAAAGEAVGSAELSPIEMEGAIQGQGAQMGGALAAEGADSAADEERRRRRRDDGGADNSEEARRVPPYLYATDLVTSSSHRRMGIGHAIMDKLERDAAGKFGAERVYLHVRPQNAAALRFYRGERRGYVTCCYGDGGGGASDLLLSGGIDAERLAENAGAVGQVLLGKVLPSHGENRSVEEEGGEKVGKGSSGRDEVSPATAGGRGGGFGGIGARVGGGGGRVKKKTKKKKRT